MAIVAGNYTLRGTKCVLPLASGQILFFFDDGFIYSGSYDGQNMLIADSAYTKLIPTGSFNWTVNTEIVAVEYDRRIWVLSNGVLHSIDLNSDGELETGYTAVLRSGKDIEEPTAQLAPAPAYVGTGYTYKTCITPVQIDPVSGLIVSEGPPISMPEYGYDTAIVETSGVAGFANPFTPSSWPAGITINALALGYTHLRMYRTKNIEADISTGTAGADPNVFWLFGTYDMVAATYKWEQNSYNPAANLAPFDRDLTIALTTRYRKWMPILTGFTIANGLLFGISGDEDNKLLYSALTTGYLAQAGLYFPGAQEVWYKSSITTVQALADAVAITTKNTTNLITPDTSVNLSGTAYGEYVPLLTSPSREISPNIGIVDRGCVFVRDNTLFARVSDGTVRSFNGQWSADIFGATLSQMLAQYPNQGQTLAVSQSGEMWLWTGAGTNKDVCINFVNNEQDGVGASLCTGGGFAQPTRQYLRTNIVEIFDSAGLSHLCIIENDGYNILREISQDVYDSNNAQDASVVAPYQIEYAPYYPRIVTREITGTSLNHFVEHERTDVYMQKIPTLDSFSPGQVSFKLLCDGSSVIAQDIPRNRGDSFAVFSGGKVCSSFQLDITFPPTRFFLPEFAVQFRSRDERELDRSTTMNSTEKVLAESTLGKMSRGNQLRIEHTGPEVVWTYSSMGGQDPVRVPMFATPFDSVRNPTGSVMTAGITVNPSDPVSILMAFKTIGNSLVAFGVGSTLYNLLISNTGDCVLRRGATDLYVWPPSVGKGYLYITTDFNSIQVTMYNANGVNIGTGGEGYPTTGVESRSINIVSGPLDIEDLRVFKTFIASEDADAYVQDIVHARYNYFPSPRYAP
jgi:hypothetical protein